MPERRGFHAANLMIATDLYVRMSVLTQATSTELTTSLTFITCLNNKYPVCFL
jgi:hypothetical protein